MNSKFVLRGALLGAVSLAAIAAPALAQDADSETQAVAAGEAVESSDERIILAQATNAPPAGIATQTATNPAPSDRVVVTARRVEQDLQDVPIPLSVVGGEAVTRSGNFNVNRLKEQIPTVQFYSTNPRNSAVNIRGLGNPFGLTNDGIEPGVGIYIDGVFNARPAAATLDFIDVERIEVLRGPQGTLYGKNTTAGALNIVTRRPSFSPEINVEISGGSEGFLQAKASITGPINNRVAARISFSGTQRDGVLYNVATQDDVNDLNNLGVRGQILFEANPDLEFILAGDYTTQRPEGYAQAVAGVAPTLRPLNRQWAQSAAFFNYAPPSYNAFDRLIDTDTPWQSHNDLGGVSLTANWDVGVGTFTSITAWRFWKWGPSNDRDFVGLPITTVSAAPSKQEQWTQEFRYAGDFSESLHFVVGAFAFNQKLNSDPTQDQVQGSAAWRFLLNPNAAAATPGLLDGYGQRITFDYDNTSAALFGQLDWEITDQFSILPGIRLNYDKKEATYDSVVFGGLDTSANPALRALQRSVLAPQSYAVDVDDTNISYNLTAQYRVNNNFNAYATYATSFKSIGINLAGVPADAAGNPALSAATVRPESEDHFEVGIKTQPLPGATLNVSAFRTVIDDYQTQVTNAGVGVLRGYLANAEEVRVQGLEADFSAVIGDHILINGAAAWTQAEYTSFPDAPPQLEVTGGPGAVDISGLSLPGISKYAASLSAEWYTQGDLLGQGGEFFIAADTSYRSEFGSAATPSTYLVIDDYALVNARFGFRADEDWSLTFWSRNLFDEEYFEMLNAQPGNSGLFVGIPGDPATYGVTLRATF